MRERPAGQRRGKGDAGNRGTHRDTQGPPRSSVPPTAATVSPGSLKHLTAHYLGARRKQKDWLTTTDFRELNAINRQKEAAP